MRPNFALDFRDSGIALLHRSTDGWRELGVVGMDAPDMAGELEALRVIARDLDPRGLATKLIIPNSQILYLSVTVSGNADSRKDEIEAALEGRTPYGLDELVYDVSGDGPQVGLAVLARETLAEAQDFAMQYRMNPVCFVAIPPEPSSENPTESGAQTLSEESGVDGSGMAAAAEDAGLFKGEVWFGPSGLASSWLPPGEKLERDTAPIRITGYGPVEDLAEDHVEGPAGALPELTPADMMPSEPNAPGAAITPQAPSESEPTPTELPAPEGPSEDPSPAPLPDPEPLHDPEPLPDPVPVPPAFDPTPDDGMTDAELAVTDLGGGDLLDQDPAMGTPPLAYADPQVSGNIGDDLPQAGAGAPDEIFDEAPMAVDVPLDDYPPTRSKAPEDQDGSTDGTEGRAANVAPAVAAAVAAAPPRAPLVIRRSDTASPQMDGPTARREPAPPLARPGVAPAAPAAGRDNATPSSATETPIRAPVKILAPAPDMTIAASRPKARDKDTGPRVTAQKILGSKILGSNRRKAGVEPVGGQGAGQGVNANTTGIRPGVAAAGKPKSANTLASRFQTSTPAANPSLASQSQTSQSKGGAMAQPSTPQPMTARAMAQSMAPSGDSSPFGFKPPAAPLRGRPRYLGLILTAILLLLLALVAGWSTYAIASRDRNANEAARTTTAQSGSQSASATSASAASASAASDRSASELAVDFSADPSTEDEMLADDQDPSDLAEPDAAPAPAEDLAANDTRAAPPPAATAGSASSAMTDIKPAAAAHEGPQDEIFLATADAPPTAAGVQELSAPAGAADTIPSIVAAPPPFGTVYKFDAEGRVLATPEGVVTPDGVMLIAGKPKHLPPERPASILAASAPPTSAAPSVAPAATSTAAANADPALAGVRPKSRPEMPEAAPGSAPGSSTAQPAAASQSDAGQASGQPPSEQASSMRPQTRPKSVLAAGEAARKDSAAASLVGTGTGTALASAELAPGALEISRRPAPRPRDLSRAVEAAVAAAVRPAPVDTPAVASNEAPASRQVALAAAAPAAVAPARPAAAAQSSSRSEIEADDEPEEVRPAPKIPVKASVAKQATMTKAINLSKTNLIGVYGSSTNRYALVRQSNGKYSKVKVGDTLDGGRVAAITTTEVRYQKGSKTLTLAMPEG